MKIISLYEPWATLVAIGAKKIETRRWGTKYRGQIAIHATMGGLGVKELRARCCSGRFYPALCGFEPFSLAVTAPVRSKRWIKSVFAHGHIIAAGDLVDCRTITCDRISAHENDLMNPPLEPELSFGDYKSGRYGLRIENVRSFPEPIPFKSRLGKLIEVEPEVTLLIYRQIAMSAPPINPLTR